MHKTIAAAFLALGVVYLVLGQVWVAIALAAGGAFMYYAGPKIEGEK